MPYFLDTTRFYRIWFSDNADVFMNDENKLRFIQLRLKNPTAKLSLVYSSKSLSEAAMAELNTFCKNLNIKPIDFDTDIPELLTDEQDKQIYFLAKQEIEHTLNKSGGNLAAASDCVRTLLPVIQKCGCYSDYDVDVDFSKANKVEQIYSPVVLNAYYDHHYMGPGGPCFNSDFLGFAYSSRDLAQLHPQAILDVRKVQAQILQNYQKITPETLFDLKPKFKSVSEDAGTKIGRILLVKYFEQYPKASLFDVRVFINSLTFEFVAAHISECTDLPEFDIEAFKEVKWQLYLSTVVYISGPGAYLALFSEFLDKDFEVVIALKETAFTSLRRLWGGFGWGYSSGREVDEYEEVIKIVPSGKWRDYTAKCERYGLKCNNLHRYVHSKQSDIKEYKQMLKEKNPLEVDIGKFCDCSWTDIGAHNQKVRSLTFRSAVKTSQRVYRKAKQYRELTRKIESLVEDLEQLAIESEGKKGSCSL